MNQSLRLNLFLIFIFIFFLRPVGGDGDFFHHLNTGRFILENHTLPKVDEFTHTANGKPWVGYAWGAGVIFYIIYKGLGPIGINLLISGLAVLTFVLLYKLLRSYSISNHIIYLILATAAPSIAIRWPNRPELFTFPFVIAILLIDRLRLNHPKITLIYPVLILVWANTYGSSVIFGLALLIFLSSWQLLNDKLKLKPQHNFFYLTTLISLPVSLLNGYGFKTVFYIFYIPRIAHNQSEWAGLFKNFQGNIDYVLFFQYWVLIYLLFLGLVIFIVALAGKTIRNHLSESLLALFIFIPFVTFRHVVLGVLFSLPLVAILLNLLEGSKRKAAITVCIIVLISTSAISLWVNPRGFGQEDDPYSPLMINFLKEHKLAGRAFNNQQIGGFLTYHLYPDILVYTDTRDDLYLQTPILTNFYDTLASGKNVLSLLEKYNIDLVIADLADGIAYRELFYSKAWAPVFLQKHYVIFVKQALAEGKKLLSLDAIDPFSASFSKEDQQNRATEQYHHLLSQDPTSFYNKLRLAASLFASKDYNQAILIANDTKLGNTPKASIFKAFLDYLLAQIYFAKLDCHRTKIYFEETRADITHKFIFTPWKTLYSPLDKGYAFYNLICERNKERAKQYLESFLKQSEVSQEEKNATVEQFNALLSQ